MEIRIFSKCNLPFSIRFLTDVPTLRVNKCCTDVEGFFVHYVCQVDMYSLGDYFEHLVLISDRLSTVNILAKQQKISDSKASVCLTSTTTRSQTLKGRLPP